MRLTDYIGAVIYALALVWCIYNIHQKEITAVLVIVQSWVLILLMKHADKLEGRIIQLLQK
jgi:hypothetical protein